MNKVASVIFGLVVSISFTGCHKDPSEKILGKWDVTWEAQGEDFKTYEPYQRVMHGQMKFDKDGEVEITAYGFDKCVFSVDTLKNSIHYRLSNNKLSFEEMPGKGGLEYMIDTFSSDKIKLSLLKDIHLTLEK